MTMKPKWIVAAVLGLVISVALIFPGDSSGGINSAGQNKKSNATNIHASSQVSTGDFIKNQSDRHLMQWFYSEAQTGLKGVALVIHGLNLDPDRMLPIVLKLNESGIDVLRLSLRGHGANYSHGKDVDEDQARLDGFKKVTYQLWINEVYWAYLRLRERGAEKDVPLFLTAFSLGGLLGLDLFASHADVKFDRLVLLAPAIRLRAIVYLERTLSPFPSLVIPSMADESYLANDKGTPIAAYNSLFRSLDNFNQNAGDKLNVPTLVFIDPQDEFIPLAKLKKLVAEKKWNQWRFYMVEKDETAEEDRFYHHIIDPSSTGKVVWQDMMKAVEAHLLD